jgi:hypothetical protein
VRTLRDRRARSAEGDAQRPVRVPANDTPERTAVGSPLVASIPPRQGSRILVVGEVALNEDLRGAIADIAAGAADGAAALRSTGVYLELEGYSVESMLDMGGRPSLVTVRVDFVTGEPDPRQRS